MNKYFRELSVTAALGVVLLMLAVMAPGFYQPQPLLSLVTREAPTLVVACGMALIIISRQIDISVGSQFSVVSVCAALLAARGWPLVGAGLELKVIAAVVVGGVAISGGRGNLWGVLAGLLLLACVSPALTHLHIEAYWEKAIQGAIILLAVVADGVRQRKLNR